MLLLALALLLPLQPQIQQENANISCAAETSQSPQGVVRCPEGAVVTYQDMRVEANWMEFNFGTSELTAGDQVRFTRGGEQLTGGRLSYNVETKTGTFTDVSGQIEGFYVRAGDYERLADGKWRLKKISATACTGDCPKWRFTFNEATITPGERVAGKNMVFRFFNVPLFYFPRFDVPTGTRDRSSGFLIPTTSTSTTKGRSVRESFFWAINRSYDATLTGEYFTKRGPAGTIDVRGLPSLDSSVNVSTLFAIDDRNPADLLPGEQKLGGYRTSIRSFSGFANNWRAVTNVDITSSFAFRQIYEEGFSVISSPLQQSTAFVTHRGSRSDLNFLYNRSAIFFSGDQSSTVLRKFPSVDYQLHTNDIGGRIPVYFSMDAGFTGTARRDSQINTPALMQRLDLHPTIDIPLLRSSLLTWSHRFGVRETLYTHSRNPDVDQEMLDRGYFDYSTKITGPQLEKSFGKWRHILEPTVEYRYVTGIDEFRKTIVVDETDLITDTNEIEYGITNHFMAGHEFLSWRVAQKLYFDPGFGGALLRGRRNVLQPLTDLTGFAFSDGEPRRFSPVVSTLRIATTPQTSTDIQVDYDTQGKGFRSAGVMGNLNRGIVNTSVAYFYNKRTDIQFPRNQLNGLITIGSQARRGLNGGFGFYYDIQQSLFRQSTAQVGYNSECYGLNFEFSQVDIGLRKETRLRFSLTLKNIGSIGTLRRQERLF